MNIFKKWILLKRQAAAEAKVAAERDNYIRLYYLPFKRLDKLGEPYEKTRKPGEPEIGCLPVFIYNVDQLASEIAKALKDSAGNSGGNQNGH